jgi:hypothetical protein
VPAGWHPTRANRGAAHRSPAHLSQIKFWNEKAQHPEEGEKETTGKASTLPGLRGGRRMQSDVLPRTFGANQFSESLPMKTFLRNSIDVLARVFIGLWWLLAAVGAVFVVERACYLLPGGL